MARRLLFCTLITFMLGALAQTQSPQRTMITTPPSVHPGADRMLSSAANRSGGTANAPPNPPADRPLDSVTRSLENLDAIRDANLGRVQSQSCPPEVAARIADLKAKLASYETGAARLPEAPLATRTRGSAPLPDPGAIANEWFKPNAAAPSVQKPEQSGLLADVLPGAPAAAQKPQADDQEVARARLELDQLSGACSGRVR